MKKHTLPYKRPDPAPAPKPPPSEERRSKLADIIIVVFPPAKTKKARSTDWVLRVSMLIRLATSAIALWKLLESMGW